MTIDAGRADTIKCQMHRNVVVKYLMKRRRSLLMTKNSEKVEELWTILSKRSISKQLPRE
ncbi:MAG TPA: hypothetical protein VKA98_08360 [Nitrososphaeraceae archaeon]|nr:hypothetical protein [Nitrososphaeraceae archaeon]